MAKKNKKSTSNKFWDNTQNWLTGAGLVPAWGIVPDAANTIISGVRTGYNKIIGDEEEAKRHATNTGINATTMIPGVGQGVGLAKLAAIGHKMNKTKKVIKTANKTKKKVTKKKVTKPKTKTKKKTDEVTERGVVVYKKKPVVKTKKTKKETESKKNQIIKYVKDGAKKVKNKTKKIVKETPGWAKRNFWDDGKWKYTVGGGGLGILKGGYEHFKEKENERKRQEYIEANDGASSDGNRRYEKGGVAPSMSSVKSAVADGQSVYLSGGVASPIADGSDAIQYTGQTHEQSNGANSGIIVDNAEVENGETQDQVAMKGGVKKDYFFSNHLKKGGIPISEWHKDIVKNGDSQQAKNALAREQEIIAGRNPDVVAKKGGFMKYAEGGEFPWQFNIEDINKDTDGDGIPDSKDRDWDGDGIPNGIDKDPYEKFEKNTKTNNKEEAKTTSPNKGKPRFNAYGEDYTKVTNAATDVGYTGGGEDGSYRAEDLGDAGIAGNQKGTGAGYYGEVSQANMNDFYNRNSALLSEMGINSAEEFDPAKHTKQFQEKYNENLSKTYDDDPELQARLEKDGISKEDYIKNSGFHGDGATGIDGKMGEFTWSKTSMGKKVKPTEEDTKIVEDEIPTDEKVTTTNTVTKEGRKRWGDGVDLSMLQFLPAAVAMTDKPDYMADPDIIVPPTVRAERIKADKIGMVNFNAERAALDMDAANFDQFVRTSGGGMSNMSNLQSNMSSKFKKRMEINAQETKANVDIEGQNVANKLNADATNQTKALEASTTNSRAQMQAQQENAKNKMYVDEFNRGADAATFDRKLQAFDTMVGGAMEMQRAREKNATDLEIAHVMDGDRDALERYQGTSTTTTKTTDYDNAEEHLKKLLKDKGVKEGSDEWNKYITT